MYLIILFPMTTLKNSHSWKIVEIGMNSLKISVKPDIVYHCKYNQDFYKCWYRDWERNSCRDVYFTQR